MDLEGTRTEVLRGVLMLANAARRAELTAYVAGHTGNVVQRGPFAGMAILEEKSWGNAGDLASKLLGFYEEELHQAVEEAIAGEPDLVLNVGCAEGFYAVGLARRLPEARVVAFDIDSAAQGICRKTAELNKVQVGVMGQATPALLQALLEGAERPYLVMDCEGAELALLQPTIMPGLARARILVECHDFANRSITPALSERFAATHEVRRIDEGGRNPNLSPLLCALPSIDRWLVISENRPEKMNWLDLVPKV